jgi:hypothetical protein
MTGFSPPLLLAGPVLRKVTPTSVTVWVATSQACDVSLDVYGSAAFLKRDADAQMGTVAANLVGGKTRATVKVGDLLHIAVVTAPITGVAPDAVCSYNIRLAVQASGGSASGQWDLGGLKLLDLGDPSDDYQGGLGFAEGRLPGFRTPPADVESLRLYHGSCFKLHGDGPSIMANLDDLLSDAIVLDAPPADPGQTDPSSTTKARPHALLLTGDQIYADEVATPLAPLLTSIGASLLRAADSAAPLESVPVPGGNPADQPVTQETFPAGRRQKLIRATAGMTSDEAPNHLIGFGEWAALYLLSWTGRLAQRLVGSAQPLWPANLAVMAPADGSTTVTVQDGQPAETIAPNPDGGTRQTATTQTPVTLDPTVKASPIDSLLTPLFTPPAAKLLDDLRTTFPTQRTDVAKVGDDGDKVRRALANIPVLTICDDHEVTDDWFITGAWRSRVLASALGRAMVRNALIAYVLFQAWGNTPEAFDTEGTPEAQFLALVPKLFDGTGTLPDPGTCQQIEALLGLDDPTGTGTTPRLTFDYHVDLAGGRLVVLDTRTHREYATPNGPPGLLTENALDAQLPITLTDDVPLLIVVSPAPVLGPRLIEEMINPITTRSWDLWHLAMRNQTEAAAGGYDVREPIGDLWFDVEFWNARPAAFERFLARVTRCPQVVILAGDVHYAASFALDYQRFTVAPSDGGAVSPDPPPASSTSRVIHFTSSAFRNAWLPWVAAFARSISVAENLEQAGFEGFNLGWTHITPPVLSGGDTAPGEARVLRARLQREPVILPTEGWKNPHSTRPPEWMYQVAPLFDTRTDDLRFADLATAGFTDTLGPAVPDVPPPPADRVTGDSLVGPGGPYEIATALHAANVEGAVVTRTLVFANNVGVVTFSRVNATSPLVVQMEIYFVRPHPVSEDEKPHPYVLHSASLAANPLTAPKQFGGPPATSQVTQS